MKRSILIVSLFLTLLGCEADPIVPIDPDGDLLPYLSSMKRVRVTLELYSRHFRYEKQSKLDPGNASYWEGRRCYWFDNSDSAFALEWADSGFISRTNFGVRQFTPYSHEYTYDKPSSSVIAGFYDPEARTLRDVRAGFKFSEAKGMTDYRFVNASLSIDGMDKGVVTDDSVEFIATGAALKSVVGLGYGAEEYWYGDYAKKSRLDSVMWEEPAVEPKLRVVFYPN